MNSADRRDILKFALGASVLPLLATQGVSAATPGASGIAPPTGSMLYRRKLERGLPGGANLTVVREFRVWFERASTGYVLNGEQLSATVDAPSNLASFARLEEQRVETGMFPILLDSAGQIMNGNGELPGTEIERAMDDVRERFPAGISGDRNEAVDFIEALHNTSTRLTAELPKDLFAPVDDVRSDRREISLPWGDSGEVSTRFEAQRDPGTMLMRHASREVVTRLGNDARRSCEDWDLLPA